MRVSTQSYAYQAYADTSDMHMRPMRVSEWYACEHATYTRVICVSGRVYVGEQEQASATASSSAALHILVASVASNILVPSDTYLVICGHV